MDNRVRRVRMAGVWPVFIGSLNLILDMEVAEWQRRKKQLRRKPLRKFWL